MSYTPRQWITALDLDFTAESTQTLSPDGNYTVGGLSWTKFNSTGDSVAMKITNGTGLVITPVSSTNISGSTFTAPTLRIPVTSIIPSFTPFMPVRIWIYVSASNEAANFDQVSFGFFIFNNGFNNQYTMQGFRGFQGGTNGWGAELTVVQSNVTLTSTSVPQSSNRVGMMSFPYGIFGGDSLLMTGSTVTGGAWPAYSSLALTAAPAVTAASSAAFASSGSGAKGITDVNVLIAALRAGSVTAFAATIARLRIDYLPIGN